MTAIATHRPSTTHCAAVAIVAAMSRNWSSEALIKTSSKPMLGQQPITNQSAAGQICWFVLLALQASAPFGTCDAILLSVVQGAEPNAGMEDVHSALDHLYVEDLITEEWHGGMRHSTLTAFGGAVVDGSGVPPSGIFRPKCWW